VLDTKDIDVAESPPIVIAGPVKKFVPVMVVKVLPRLLPKFGVTLVIVGCAILYSL
jgi:hypothetical protein